MRCAFLTILLGASLTASANLTLDIDYSLDTNNFFDPNTANGQAARAALARAAQWHTDRYLDNWAAIIPGGGNTWATDFTHPGTGAAHHVINNLNIPANTIKVFAGGRSLALDEAHGRSGPGGYTASSAFGDTAFLNAVQFRGQSNASGPTPTDFGTWGGGVAFDTGTDWHFGLDAPPAGKIDFYSVAIHELAHLLGFGTSASFTSTFTSGTTFTGPKAKALNGGVNVPLTPGEVPLSHWTESVQGQVGSAMVKAAMTSETIAGQRKHFTAIDYAAMDDIGYDLARKGDANADGSVGFADLVKVASNFGVNTGLARWADGDFDGDGNIGFTDLVAAASAFGLSGPQPGSTIDLAAIGVPEPGALGLVGLTVLLLRRNRNARSA
jgi:hypothetical protein